MSERFRYLLDVYFRSSAILVLLVGIAKIISGLGDAKVLGLPDPIFGVSFRHLFCFVGSIECFIGLNCFRKLNMYVKAFSLAWLATCYAVYRIGLAWVGYFKPCNCLGTLTDVLQISPETADNLMKCMFAYLLIGSYLSLIYIWRQDRQILSSKV